MTQILTKEFSLGDVLSITTGRLVSERHMDGVYDILNWMTGDSLFTHQLPRAAEACSPILTAQFPQLDPKQNLELQCEVDGLVEMIETPNGKAERDALITGWLAGLKTKYGCSFQVAPLRDWQSQNPLVEAVEMFSADKVIPIQIQPGDEFPAQIDTT